MVGQQPASIQTRLGSVEDEKERKSRFGRSGRRRGTVSGFEKLSLVILVVEAGELLLAKPEESRLDLLQNDV